MKKLILSLAMTITCILFISSCATVNPIAATSNPVGSKSGTATEIRIFFIPISEAGINNAAKNGDIKKVSYVDSRTQFLWPFFGKRKTVVYGE